MPVALRGLIPFKVRKIWFGCQAKGHTRAAAGALVGDLRAAAAAGASRSRMVTVLPLYGDDAIQWLECAY